MSNLFERQDSEFGNKEALEKNKTLFCVFSIKLKSTTYGEKWFVEIFHDEIIEVITFGRTEKRDEQFAAAADRPEEFPQHRCYLRKWEIGGKSGYHLNQKSGGGPCPCTPGEVSVDPFLPDFDDEKAS